MLSEKLCHLLILSFLLLSDKGVANSESRAQSQATIRVVSSSPSEFQYGRSRVDKNTLTMNLPSHYDVNLIQSGDSGEDYSKVFKRVVFDKKVKRIEFIF